MKTISYSGAVTEVDTGRPAPKMGDHRHNRQPPVRDYSVEGQRVWSFRNWPATAPVSGEGLARAGFYYLGQGLEVVCFSCGARRADWSHAGADQLGDGHADDCAFRRGVAATSTAVQEEDEEETTRSPAVDEPPSRSTGGPLSWESDAVSQERHLHRGLPEFVKVWPQLSQAFVCESERAKTFADWPLAFVRGADLSAAGFVYLRDADRVQCVFCHGEVMDWEENDVPLHEHRRHFPRCPLMLGVAPNVAAGSRPPVETNPPSPSTFARRGYDECGGRATPPPPPSAVLPPSVAPHAAINSSASPVLPSAQQLSDLNVVPHNQPQYPKFATREARLKSYKSWPKGGAQSVNSLAEAGLFYVGSNDQVKCFQCGGGLQNWEPEDVPWEEHARWFPRCTFVILNKGREYVERSKQHRPPVLPQTDRATETVGGGGGRSASFVQQQPPAHPTPTERELDALMNDDTVKVVMELGFDRLVVRQVLRRRMEQAGYQFANADLLATAVLEHGDGVSTTPKPEETSTSDPVRGERQRPVQTAVNMEATAGQLAEGDELTTPSSVQEVKLCKVCMDREMNVVFLPCGHFMVCTECASAMTDCPLCRVPIKGTVRTYWP